MRSAKERLAILAASSALATLLLAGCGSTPIPPPTPAPTTSASVFASEDEALAAATEAYAAYQAMSNIIAQEGGSDPDRISEFTEGEALEAEMESLTSLNTGNLRGVGELAFDRLTLQSVDLRAGNVEAYLCLDVSRTDVVDEFGQSVVPVDRPLRLPLQVSFTTTPDSDRLRVERSESWHGDNFC
jgi:hypothetical protein